MRSIEHVTQRLAEILDELSALPDGPSPERFELLKEQDTLRAEAREWETSADEGRSTESLQAELSELQRRRRSMVVARGGFVMGEGADSAGRISAELTKLQGRTGGEAEIGRMNARIARIEDILSSREGDT